MAKNGVDGIFTADPKADPKAELIKNISYEELFNKNLEVMDRTAVAMLEGSNVDLRVFNMDNLENFEKVIDGDETVGTTVYHKE